MPRLTAADLCASRRREIGALLDLIRERTTTGDMAADTWPVAGTLGYVRLELCVAAMNLSGESDEDKARCAVADEIAKRVEPACIAKGVPAAQVERDKRWREDQDACEAEAMRRG